MGAGEVNQKTNNMIGTTPPNARANAGRLAPGGEESLFSSSIYTLAFLGLILPNARLTVTLPNVYFGFKLR